MTSTEYAREEKLNVFVFLMSRCENGRNKLEMFVPYIVPKPINLLHVDSCSYICRSYLKTLFYRYSWCISTHLPGTVCDFHTDTVTLLASTLGGGIVTGSCPTQTGPRAASIIMTAHGPAWPGAKASIDCHITDLLGPKIQHLKVMAFLRKRSLH